MRFAWKIPQTIRTVLSRGSSRTLLSGLLGVSVFPNSGTPRADWPVQGLSGWVAARRQVCRARSLRSNLRRNRCQRCREPTQVVDIGLAHRAFKERSDRADPNVAVGSDFSRVRAGCKGAGHVSLRFRQIK